jgi:hypothetical protein
MSRADARAVKAGPIELLPQRGNLGRLRLEDNHVQRRLPQQFLEQAAIPCPQPETIPLGIRRLLEDLLDSSPAAAQSRRQLGGFVLVAPGVHLRGAEAVQLTLLRHHEELAVAGEHVPHVSGHLLAPDDLGRLVALGDPKGSDLALAVAAIQPVPGGQVDALQRRLRFRLPSGPGLPHRHGLLGFGISRLRLGQPVGHDGAGRVDAHGGILGHDVSRNGPEGQPVGEPVRDPVIEVPIVPDVRAASADGLAVCGLRQAVVQQFAGLEVEARRDRPTGQ